MHDLHEADKILKLILEYGKKNQLKKITSAVIRLGVIIEHGSEIQPDNLYFNIKMLAKDTMAENIELDIKTIKSDSWELVEIKGE